MTPKRAGDRGPKPLHTRAELASAALHAELDRLNRRGIPAPCQRPGQGDRWTSDDPQALELAAELCRQGCPDPVRRLCREYADAANVSWGAYGGTVRQQRRSDD